MAQGKQRVNLGPFLGVNSTRVQDQALGGMYLRGGFNVELRDGEWWSRLGETLGAGARIGSCPWWWVMDVNRTVTIIANPWWVLTIKRDGTVDAVYDPAVTEDVIYTNGSTAATSTTTRVVDQMMIPNIGVAYRVVARTGTAITLDRPFESGSATYSTKFIDPLARNTAGTAIAFNKSDGATKGPYYKNGSCILFEQLVTHTLHDVHGASPATTAGNIYLIITSNPGVPVAIDISAYMAGSPVGVLRSWFYNTALAAPAIVGTDTDTDLLKPHGVYAENYRGRLFIGAAGDPNGAYGSRTLWYSQIGDFLQWHTGIAAQTAAPNFITFGGEGNAIRELKTLDEVLVAHRDDNQEVISDTQSLSTPFTVVSNSQKLGVRMAVPVNCVASTGHLHFMWTRSGPAVFDGQKVTLIAREAFEALSAYGMALGNGNDAQYISHFVLDSLRQRIYWFSGQYSGTMGIVRHQDALPAAASVTYADGTSTTNYITCFVYDYGTDSCWFEDRPICLGGGMAILAGSSTGANMQRPFLSRLDGTIVSMTGSGASPDPTNRDKDYQLTSGASAISVYAQAETPWLDLGTPFWKHLTMVDTTERSLLFGNFYEPCTGAAGNRWLRLRIFGDLNRNSQLAGVGVVYDSTAAQAVAANDYRQPATFARSFTMSVGGMLFKLVWSNGLTSAATTAGYVQAPFRLSGMALEFAPKESSVPLTTLSGASIAE